MAESAFVPREKAAGVLGFWSGILCAAWMVWFTAAFALYMPILQRPWHGIEDYAAHFAPGAFAAWVVPCLLLAFTFPVLIAVIDHRAPAEKKILSRVGLIFAVLYAGVLSTFYFVQLVMVRSNLINGRYGDLLPLVFSYPGSVFGVMEAFGYGLMGLATLFTAPLFKGHGLNAWIRWIFYATGIAGILAFLGPFLPFLQFSWFLLLMAWCVAFPVAAVMAGVVLRRNTLAG